MVHFSTLILIEGRWCQLERGSKILILGVGHCERVELGEHIRRVAFGCKDVSHAFIWGEGGNAGNFHLMELIVERVRGDSPSRTFSFLLGEARERGGP